MFLIFLGTEFDSEVLFLEQSLAIHLSKKKKVVCFEYPRFKNLFKILTGKIPLIEKKTNNLAVLHSFGILPFGRTLIFVNFINHLISLFIFKLVLIQKFPKFILTSSPRGSHGFLRQLADSACHPRGGFTKIITFTPELALISPFLPKLPIFYYVQDEATTLPWWNGFFQRWQFKLLENRLLKITKKVLVATKVLYNKYIQYHHHQNVVLFPIPSEVSPYLSFKKDKNKTPNDIKEIPKPIIGFIGTMADWKLDLRLLSIIISKYKNISFVFLGKINDKRSNNFRKLLGESSNCYYLGNKPISSLPPYILEFSVCLIPYKVNRWGKAAYPVKIMEYLSMGKPVVTTALPSVKYLADKGLIHWAKDDDEFIEFIDLALKEKKNSKVVAGRQEEARKNSWERRIEELIEILE